MYIHYSTFCHPVSSCPDSHRDHFRTPSSPLPFVPLFHRLFVFPFHLLFSHLLIFPPSAKADGKGYCSSHHRPIVPSPLLSLVPFSHLLIFSSSYRSLIPLFLRPTFSSSSLSIIPSFIRPFVPSFLLLFSHSSLSLLLIAPSFTRPIFSLSHFLIFSSSPRP